MKINIISLLLVSFIILSSCDLTVEELEYNPFDDPDSGIIELIDCSISDTYWLSMQYEINSELGSKEQWEENSGRLLILLDGEEFEGYNNGRNLAMQLELEKKYVFEFLFEITKNQYAPIEPERTKIFLRKEISTF
jgi:hypothetical protein